MLIFKIICYVDKALEGEINEKVLKTIKEETLKLALQFLKLKKALLNCQQIFNLN